MNYQGISTLEVGPYGLNTARMAGKPLKPVVNPHSRHSSYRLNQLKDK